MGMTGSKRSLAALFSGLLFGAGLAVSQMINPQKILNFLDIAGNWDPSLALVMLAALAVSTVGFKWVLHTPKPLLDVQFHLPTSRQIDKRLVLGALVFGIGWGLAGYCPGPGVAAIALGTVEPLVFTAAVIAGFVMHRIADKS